MRYPKYTSSVIVEFHKNAAKYVCLWVRVVSCGDWSGVTGLHVYMQVHVCACVLGVYSMQHWRIELSANYKDDILPNVSPALLPPALHPCPSPTREYYVQVWYKYGPMVERGGELYCNSDSHQPYNKTEECLEPLVLPGCPSHKCPFDTFIE